MFHGMVLALVLLSGVDPFEAAKSKAVPAESLQKLLDAFGMPPCKSGDPVEDKECEARVAAAQVPYKGKPLYLNLGGGFENLMEPLDSAPGQAGVVLTPVIDGGTGIALTFARPRKVGKDGGVVVPRVPIEGPLIDDTMPPGDLKRLLRTGQISLEAVGTVKGPWELKRGKEEPLKGVEFAVTALRLSHRRTGKALVSQVK